MTVSPPSTAAATAVELTYVQGIYQYEINGPSNAGMIGTLKLDGTGGGAVTDSGDPGQKHFVTYGPGDISHSSYTDALGGIYYNGTFNFHPLSGLPTGWLFFADSAGNLHLLGQTNGQANGWDGTAWK